MKQLLKSDSLSIGLAIFSMFFGAGNIIFPLALGLQSGDKNHYAVFGLILTAAIMPIAGVIAMILYQGSTREFFGRLGRIPGFLLAFLTISLLGPLGSTPRCIALSYTTLNTAFPFLSFTAFSAFSCVIIFALSLKKNHILTLLGWVLTPFLLLSLLTIIGLGFFTPSQIQSTDQSALKVFCNGLNEGYNTMDLLAAFFFSTMILNILRMRSQDTCIKTTAYRASLIGTILLGLVYIGFSYLAAFHGYELAALNKDELLAAITLKIAGSHGGFLVCLAISLACLTTAIALISSFADFIQNEFFDGKNYYQPILAGSLLATFIISTLEFNGISKFLGPILEMSYPGLIVLTILNILHRTIGLKVIKRPVFFTFFVSVIVYIYQH